MKKINYSCEETVYEEKLDNGLRVYLYPTNKSKNFYITVSTFFGAEVSKYKKNNKVYDVTLGSAHFLEHRVMDFTKNKEAMKKISEYGSLVNAYTTYNGTNYNIFGQEKIYDNLILLFDRVFKANIKEEDVKKEKGIILEELNMCESDPYYKLETKVLSNTFMKSFVKYPVIGTEEGIKNASAKELNRLYKDFYTPENMFIVVCGDFDKEEMINFIKDYTKDIKPSKDKISIIKEKEDDEVSTNEEVINLNLNEEKTAICYKVKIPKNVDKIRYKLALNLAVGDTFSKSGKAFEELRQNGISRFSSFSDEVNGYIAIVFKASTSKIEVFRKIVDKYLGKLKLDKDILERKKRRFIKSFILSFENIMDVEDNITSDMFDYKKIINNSDVIVNSLTVKECNDYLKTVKVSNKTYLTIE